MALSQPPSQITSLSVCELKASTTSAPPPEPSASPPSASPSSATSIGVLVGVGTPHGFALLHHHTPAPSATNERAVEEDADGNEGQEASKRTVALVVHCTVPGNSEALADAAVGEGWARRRTRELKNSLRDSFRRLKRMRSVGGAGARSGASTKEGARAAASSSSAAPAPPHPITRASPSARVGLRRSVTQVCSSCCSVPGVHVSLNLCSTSRYSFSGPLKHSWLRIWPHPLFVYASSPFYVSFSSSVFYLSFSFNCHLSDYWWLWHSSAIASGDRRQLTTTASVPLWPRFGSRSAN